MKARGDGIGRLSSREELSPTLGIFRFELEGGTPPFEPGQYLTLGLPSRPGSSETVWRPYSIASAPDEKREVEFYVRWAVHPVAGVFTTQLGRLAPGDAIRWRKPKGRFTLVHRLADGRPDTRRLVLLAGGTGLAPFIAYVRHLRSIGSERAVVVCHGASYVGELGYRGLLAGLAAENPRFLYVPTISRPLERDNERWSGAVGRVQRLIEREGGGASYLERLLGERLSPETSFVHACGFRATVDAVVELLEPLGFRSERQPHADGRFDFKWESFG